ncbi:MAG: hypothetical protein HZA50_13175 [Planctomycetes bacterium]|nr:hypothetical protein [Planctomycetota bacterium]
MNDHSFFDFISNKDLLVIFTIIFTVVYGYTTAFFLYRIRRRRLRNLFTFYKAISVGLNDGTIQTLEDFINIYKGIHGLSSDDTTYRQGLVRLLRRFIVDLVLRETHIREPALIIAYKEKLTKLIEEMARNEPFVNLPNAERTVLNDVSKMIELGDTKNAIHKLEEIAGLIEARQDSIERLEKSNKWAIPLATIGLILTIVFGIISIFK